MKFLFSHDVAHIILSIGVHIHVHVYHIPSIYHTCFNKHTPRSFLKKICDAGILILLFAKDGILKFDHHLNIEPVLVCVFFSQEISMIIFRANLKM